MSRRRKAWMRDVNGILLLDKPVGASSNQVLQRVRHHFHACPRGASSARRAARAGQRARSCEAQEPRPRPRDRRASLFRASPLRALPFR